MKAIRRRKSKNRFDKKGISIRMTFSQKTILSVFCVNGETSITIFDKFGADAWHHMQKVSGHNFQFW